MVAPAHHRLTFHGTFGAPATAVETWSFGVSIGGILEQDKTELDGLAADMLTAYTNLQPVMTNAVYLTGIKLALRTPVNGRLVTPRDQDGRYIQGEYVHTSAQAYQGTGTLPQPFHNALAVTLDSAVDGPTGRGRFYLPCPAAAPALLTGVLAAADQNTVATQAKAFLNAINTRMSTIWDPNPRVVVASGGSVGKGLAGALNEVTGVRVGRIIDVQQRRTNDQDEAYVSATL